MASHQNRSKNSDNTPDQMTGMVDVRPGDMLSERDVQPGAFHVVGLGASAGGLQPLQQFLDNLPTRSGVACVIVQHLSPDFESLMKELLSRHTAMQVQEAEDGMQIERDSVYLIPPKYNIVVQNARLRLRDRDVSPEHRVNHPIDEFFQSMAHDYHDRSIGVVLSGTGTDGSRGVREINEAGGLVIAQDPDSAQFDGMPLSAINTDMVHHVLPPDEIAQKIYNYVNRPDHEQGEQPLIAGVSQDQTLSEFIDALRLAEGGIDFSHYKSATLARRISRRMKVAGFDSVERYLRRITDDEQERTALRNDLLINVTSFFRDPPAWKSIDEQILDGLIQEAKKSGQIRIWIAACATGEEVYSLAMMISERLDEVEKQIDVKIFATDVDLAALETASAGIYNEGIETEIETDRLNRFFERRGDRYQVRRELRRLVIFAQHNLTRDAAFTKMDLVICRNVLIYMQPHLQHRVISVLHFALRQHGYLFLGSAETPGDLTNEFEVIDRRWKIYRKHRDIVLPFGVARNTGRATFEPIGMARPAPARGRTTRPDPIVHEAMRQLLVQRDAACMIINNQGELLHTLGHVEDYLNFPEGQATTEVTRLVPKSLALPLKTAIHRARKESEPVCHKMLALGENEQDQDKRLVDMTVSVHRSERGNVEFMMVVIEPTRTDGRHAMSSDSDAGRLSSRAQWDANASDRSDDLERELERTRENLQATIEELETANEEEQATNEELVAANEELQSTNEELHSVNEELHTVNTEYHTKIQELSDLNNDMDNLLRSTDIGTIFLDSDLRVRKFTPAVRDVISLIDRDIGRPIENFAANISGADILESARSVLTGGKAQEKEVTTRSGKVLLMRVGPYRTDQPLPDGVVVTFVDISDLKKAERSMVLLTAMVESSPDAIIGKSLDGTITSWNQGAQRMFGYHSDEAIGKHVSMLAVEGEQEYFAEFSDKIGKGESITNYESVRRHKDGSRIPVSLTVAPVYNDQGEIMGASSIARDISSWKKIEQALRDRDEQIRQQLVMLEHVYVTSPVALGLIDNNLKVLRVNQAWCDINNLDCDEVIGKPISEIPFGQEKNRFMDICRKVIDRDESIEDVELVIAGADQEPRTVLSSFVSVDVDSHGRKGVGVVQRDITDHRRAETALAQANIDLRDKSREIEDFVYTVSHDLQSPLVTIKGYAGHIRRATSQQSYDKLEDYSTRIERAATRMHRHIEDLLELSRIGRLELQHESLDLNDLVAQLVDEMDGQIRAAQVQVEIKPGLPVVNGDPARIAQVFQNLVGNAIKHGRPDNGKQPKIIIGASRAAGEVRAYVQDNGPGIPESMRKKVFGLFQRLARDDSGTGIGLAIVKRVIELHNGRAWVESVLDHTDEPGDKAQESGARFWIALPQNGEG